MKALQSLACVAMVLGVSPAYSEDREPKTLLGRPLPASCSGQTDGARRACLGWMHDVKLTIETPLYQDAELNLYVKRVGLRIARAAGLDGGTFTFRVLDTGSVIGWAAIGGYVYVSRGALAALNSEAEMAALLAHEVAHHAAGHTAKAWSAFQWSGDELPDDLAIQVVHDRDEERQADALAVGYLRAAGYDPNAVPAMLRGLPVAKNADKHAMDRTHPPRSVRIARTSLLSSGATGLSGRERYRKQVLPRVAMQDPRGGYVHESFYIHPPTGVAFSLDKSWLVSDTAPRLQAKAESPKARLVAMPLEAEWVGMLSAALQTDTRLEPAEGVSVETGWFVATENVQFEIEGVDGAEVHVRGALVRFRDRTLMVSVVAMDRPHAKRQMEHIVGSIRRASAAERARRLPAVAQRE